MTTKLFYDSAYLNDWTTRIANLEERKDGLYAELAETAFYPEGGGQPGDTGRIGEARVLDTIAENGRVLHRVDRLPGETGGEVSCSLDRDRRFDHMQQHSGQHLLSATCLDLLGAPTLSFHLGEDYATIDIGRPELGEADTDALEREINLRIVRNLPIKSYWIRPEEVSSLPLVKPPAVEGDVRIVEIEGIEYNACGGTHVRHTGELGVLKLLRSEKHKGHIRLYFKAGGRAVREFALQSKILGELSARLSTPKEELPARIGKWAEDERRLRAEAGSLRERLDAFAAAELLAEHGGRDGQGAIGRIFEDRTVKELQSLFPALTSRTSRPVVLASLPELKLMLARDGADGFSCGALFKETLPAYGGRGGGGDKSAQAAFASEEELRAFYVMLMRRFAAE